MVAPWCPRLQVDRSAFGCGEVKRLDRARLADGVGPREEGLGVPSGGAGEVGELEGVRIRGRNFDSVQMVPVTQEQLPLPVRPPRCVDEQPTVVAHDVEALVTRQRERAVIR